MAKDLEAPKPFVPSGFADGNKLDAGGVEEMRFGLAGSGPLAKAVLDSNNVGALRQLSAGLTPTTTIPVGTISPYAGTSAPANWLLCDGSAVPRDTYAALFAVTSTAYGAGNGTTTFNVPDLRGRTIVGSGTGAQRGVAGSGVITGGTALTARGVGQFFGDERLQGHTHTFSGTTANETQDHIHGFNPRSAGGWDSGATQLIINAGSQYWGLRSSANNGDGGTTGPTYGRSASHNHTYSGTVLDHNQTPVGVQQNLQPSVVTSYIIKAVADVSNTFGVALAGAAGGGLTGTYPNPDVVYGHKICTSGARPSPLTGMMAYETDTSRIKVWTGSDWKTIGYDGWEDKPNRVQFTWIGAINQSFVVPAGVYVIYGKVWGSSGGSGRAGGWSYGGPGGGGGYGGGLIPVTPGETLTIMAGQHGYPAGSGNLAVGTRGFGGGPTASQNGSDNQYSGGGGGFSGIFRGTPAQGTALLMAGGGGGGGSTRATYGAGVSGGAGGGITGEIGHSMYDQKWAYGGRAGTQTGGGGQPSSDLVNQDASGGALYGGFARGNSYGGGGGGGYFGGGGGGYSESNTMGGGGGGSGFAHSSVINPQLLTGTGPIPANYDDPDMPRDGSNTSILTAVGPPGITAFNIGYGGIGAVVIRY